MATSKKAVEQAPAQTEQTKVNESVNGANVIETAPKVEQTPQQMLDELNGKLAEQKSIIKSHILGGGEMDDKPVLDANLEIFRLQNLIKNEQSKLDKLAKDQELSEKRNARVALADNLINAVLAAYGITERNTENDAQFKSQEDVVKNELLAKYATSTPAKKESDGSTTASKGATSQAIRERYIALTGEGKTSTEAIKAIIAEGFSRGTTGAVVLAYQKEIGEKS